MKNEARVGRVIVGGQPSAEELQSGRFSSVVNLREPDEAGNTTAADVAGRALEYHAVPLTAETLSAEHVLRVQRALDAASGEVLIH